MSGAEFFGQQFISGLGSGSLYAMLAMAVVLVYKSTDMVNFAQGEMAMVCGYFSYTMLTSLHLSYPIVIVLVIIFGAALGVIGDRILFRPLLKVPAFSFVIATLGLNVAMNSGALFIWGSQPLAIPSLFSPNPVHLGGMVISREHLAVILITLAMVAVLTALFRWTMTGLALRTVAVDRTVASIMGVNVKRSFSMTWALASGIGGLLGLLFANVTILTVDYMSAVLIKAFIGACLGGLLSLPGAVFGGLALGVMENLAGGYVSADFKEFLPLVVIMIVLLVKPQGLFGRKVVTKV